MKTIRQMCALTAMAMKGLPSRKTSSLVVVLGMAAVVGVLISVLAMATGLRTAIRSGGQADRAVLLRAGAGLEITSSIERDTLNAVRNAPGIRALGAEVVFSVNLPQTTGAPVSVLMRGIDSAREVRREIELSAGRYFAPGMRELIVGDTLAARYPELNIGKTMHLRDGEWEVVGTFRSRGDSHESELITDVNSLLAAYRRNFYSSVLVQLDSAEAFQPFKDAITSNPALSLAVWRESEFYDNQAQGMSRLLIFVSYFVGGVMGIGAALGALNTMYTTVGARQTELATLQALGFGATAIITSVLFEAIALSAIGACCGLLLAYLILDGNLLSTVGSIGDVRQVVFQMQISPQLISTGLTWACFLGAIGGIFPAISAVRLPTAVALRSK